MKILLLFVFLLLKPLEGFNYTIWDPCPHRFIIVVDGGSTGTRCHVFKFNKNKNSTKLLHANTFKSKIALSSFTHIRQDWCKLENVFLTFTINALPIIPRECVQKTPIYVQVTAGFRQIDQTISKRILNYIRTFVIKMKFKFKPEYVGILTPAKEGLLAWISVNFLLNRLQAKGAYFNKTLGIVDIGGGSTQIAFATNRTSLFAGSTKIKLFGKVHHIYAAGYNYMGMDDIRKKYLLAEGCGSSNCENKTLRSICLHPNFTGILKSGNQTFRIGGKPGTDRFKHCWQRALSLINSMVPVIQYHDKTDFVAMSTFSRILLNTKVNLQLQRDKLNQTTVTHIINTATKICESPKPFHKLKEYEQFRCLDLAYFIAIFDSGYQFDWNNKIILTTKINNTSLSWALGYAISTLK